MEVGNNMDKYPKMLEPSMKRWLAEHYSPEEAKERWERTVDLDERWCYRKRTIKEFLELREMLMQEMLS